MKPEDVGEYDPLEVWSLQELLDSMKAVERRKQALGFSALLNEAGFKPDNEDLAA